MGENEHGNSRFGWLVAAAPLVVAALVIALILALSKPAGSPVTMEVSGEGYPRTIVERFPDGTEGKRLTLPAPPQRIVSVNLATDEILLDLVAPSRIAALSYLAPRKGCRIANRAKEIKHFVGDDVERIIALKPDLCFLASYNREESRSLLTDVGIPVFTFQSFNSFDDIRWNILTVGAAVGADARAKEMVAEMDRRLGAIAKRLPPRDRWPTLLCYGQSGWIAGRETTYTDVIESAGARNAAGEAGIKRFAKISVEKVIVMNPDYLLIVSDPGGMAGQKEWLLVNPALAGLKAIRGKRFISVQGNALSSVSHSVVDAVEEIAAQLYPDRFSNAKSAE